MLSKRKREGVVEGEGRGGCCGRGGKGVVGKSVGEGEGRVLWKRVLWRERGGEGVVEEEGRGCCGGGGEGRVLWREGREYCRGGMEEEGRVL